MNEELDLNYDEPTDEELAELDAKAEALMQRRQEEKEAQPEQMIADRKAILTAANQTNMSTFFDWLDAQPWTPRSQDTFDDACKFLLEISKSL